MANKYLADTSGVTVELEANSTSVGSGDAGKIVALDSTGHLDPSLFPMPSVMFKEVVLDTFPIESGTALSSPGVDLAAVMSYHAPSVMGTGWDSNWFFKAQDVGAALVWKDQNFADFAAFLAYCTSTLTNDSTEFTDNYTITIYFYQNQNRLDIPRIYPKNYFYFMLRGGSYKASYKSLSTTSFLFSGVDMEALLISWLDVLDPVMGATSAQYPDMLGLFWMSRKPKFMYDAFPAFAHNEHKIYMNGGTIDRKIFDGADDSIHDIAGYSGIDTAYIVKSIIAGYNLNTGICTIEASGKMQDKEYLKNISYVRIYMIKFHDNPDLKAYYIKPMGQDFFSCGYFDPDDATLYACVYNNHSVPVYKNVHADVTIIDNADINTTFTVNKSQYLVWHGQMGRGLLIETRLKSMKFLTCTAPGYFTAFSEPIIPLMRRRGVKYGMYLGTDVR